MNSTGMAHTRSSHCLHEEAGLAKYAHIGGCLSGVCGLAAVEDHKIILTTNKPIASKAYPVPFHLRDALKKELREKEEEVSSGNQTHLMHHQWYL